MLDRMGWLFAEYLPRMKLGGGDTSVDRLNTVHSRFLLLMVGFLLQVMYFLRKPVSCWSPAHFTSAQTEFVDWVGKPWSTIDRVMCGQLNRKEIEHSDSCGLDIIHFITPITNEIQGYLYYQYNYYGIVVSLDE